MAIRWPRPFTPTAFGSFGRSLKYHRPRGLYSLDGECSNTCMSVNGIPNVRTETTLLKAGMRVDVQNVTGSAESDLMGFMDKFDWLMPDGMMAALSAAEGGLRVILLESRPWLGGCFDYRTAAYSTEKPLYQSARELADLVAADPNIRTFLHAPVIGAYSNNRITAFQVGGKSDDFKLFAIQFD